MDLYFADLGGMVMVVMSMMAVMLVGRAHR